MAAPMASYRPNPPQHAYSASSSSSLTGGGGGGGAAGRYVPYASAAPGASSSSGSDMMSPPGSARILPPSSALGRQNGSQSSQRGYAQQPYHPSSGLGRTNGSQSSQQSRGGPGGSVDYPTIHGAHDDEQMRVRRPRPDTEEIKRVGRTHYQELLGFLRSHLQKGQTGPRSNAREKLTRLSKQQFTELSTDVYDELMRRLSNGRSGVEMPHLAVREEFHPKRNQARQKLATLPKTRFKDLSSDVFFELERRFPELRDEFRPEAMHRERDELSAAAAAAASASTTSAAGTTADVIIPAKSTLVSEDIAVPYSTAEGDTSAASTSRDAPLSPARPSNGARARASDSDDAADHEERRETMYSQASSVGTGFFNGYAASRGTESIASPSLGSREPPSTFGIEKLRSDYEFRIATLQQRVGTLETQASEAREEADDLRRERERWQADMRAARERQADLEKDVEEEKRRHEELERDASRSRERHDKSSAELQSTLRQLDELRSQHEALQTEREARGDSESVEQLREELSSLQSEYSHQEELVQELRGEVTSLLDELRQLSARNDSMQAEKESDLAVVRDLNNQMQGYKRKYESAKTELRALKATSQLFVQPPKADDVMQTTERGAIADINLTAFQSSIDELLSAARSKSPGSVLLSMKTVVLATTLVTDDAIKWETTNGSELSPEEREQLVLLKSKASGTLNNLMTACRNHASSHGMSPVSLLDAAASHVSSTVVDLAKLLKIRKASQSETDELEATFAQGTLANGLKPLHINAVASASSSRETPFSPSSLSAGAEFRPRVPATQAEDRLNPNSASDGARFSPRTHGTLGRYSPVGYRPDVNRKNSHGGEVSWRGEQRQRAASISSTSSAAAANGNAAPPAVPDIHQALRSKSINSNTTTRRSSSSASPPRSPGRYGNGDAAPGTDDSEENWAELRNYIEVQTESIVHAIQALLSAIREGATGVQLNENLEQITTIVSSIIAISKDNLPAGPRAAEGERILQALTVDCEKLSEMQSRPTFDKATKSTMASASYGVAKGLKALNALLSPLE